VKDEAGALCAGLNGDEGCHAWHEVWVWWKRGIDVYHAIVGQRDVGGTLHGKDDTGIIDLVAHCAQHAPHDKGCQQEGYGRRQQIGGDKGHAQVVGNLIWRL